MSLRYRGIGEMNLAFVAGGGYIEHFDFKCKIL
jgi:hypothetical protein